VYLGFIESTGYEYYNSRANNLPQISVGVPTSFYILFRPRWYSECFGLKKAFGIFSNTVKDIGTLNFPNIVMTFLKKKNSQIDLRR
jgi:hypothetical protein